ncbi:hypothetical protein OAT16_11245 [Prolixibacteraceae bacterium]|nr:hypothetical protein [Prolixibacteraceae bacterium]
MKTAIVDLGTNTCTLVIAEVINNNLISHYKKSLPVTLGSKENYENNYITQRGVNNIIKVLSEHQRVALDHNIKILNIFATSAVREANNSKDILLKISQNDNFKVTIISGKQEAEITTLAILNAIEGTNTAILTMDIGGGSNEFVIIKDGKTIWSQSFKTGMARILRLFPFEDTIDQKNIRDIIQYYQQQHKVLWEMIAKYNPTTLVGSSGAFDTYVDLIYYQKPISHLHRLNKIELNDYTTLHHKLTLSSSEERKNMAGMVPIRETMIVYASLLTNLVVTNSNISKIYQTGYALAEGVLFREKQQ